MFSSYGTGQQPPPVHQESGFKGLNTTLQQSSPFQENFLASGGELDLCIKFWNTQTGLCLSSVDTGSQVCGFLWNNYERELLSCHGFSKNELILWKYPSMVRMAELTGHTSRVLFMTQVLIWTLNCTLANSILFVYLISWIGFHLE